MSKQLNLGIIFGGRSVEHEVSLQSVRNIIQAIDKNKYNIIPIFIAKDGHWHLLKNTDDLLAGRPPKVSVSDQIAIIPGTNRFIQYQSQEQLPLLDVVFPVLHGGSGEDGSLQGLLRLANLPFVGANVLGSAVGMDKDVMKRLLREAGLPIVDFIAFSSSQKNNINFEDIKKKLGLPLFIKPANTGSSVGIQKASTAAEFKTAINDAFRYDTKIVIEQSAAGREFECSVLGNDKPQASLAGEIVPHAEFYSYAAKYLDPHGADLIIPAKISADTMNKIRTLAIQVYQVLNCAGMARVDFFMRDQDEIIINEINTLPGFTNISMYPQLWQASGLSYSALIDKLIKLALARFDQESHLQTTFPPSGS